MIRISNLYSTPSRLISRRPSLSAACDPSVDGLDSSFLWLECVVHVRYYSELLRFFMHEIKDVHDSQDLVQQTFERVLERSYAGDQVVNPRALLFEVARNLLIDRHRQAQIRRHESDDVLREHSGPAAAEPEAMYAGNQRVVLLVAAIEALPPRCRKAFIRHKIDGLSHAEVACEMGVSLNMVERHVMLAVAACRKALGDLPAPRRARVLQAAAGDPASD